MKSRSWNILIQPSTFIGKIILKFGSNIIGRMERRNNRGEYAEFAMMAWRLTWAHDVGGNASRWKMWLFYSKANWYANDWLLADQIIDDIENGTFGIVVKAEVLMTSDEREDSTCAIKIETLNSECQLWMSDLPGLLKIFLMSRRMASTLLQSSLAIAILSSLPSWAPPCHTSAS